MSENNSVINTREAAKILECTARHIQNLIKNGRISASRDECGNYVIDKSEFYRVFPDSYNKRSKAKSEEDISRITFEMEIKHLKAMLEEKTKQNDFLYKQLDTITIEKTMLIETLNSNQKLLENQNPKRKKIFGIF